MIHRISITPAPERDVREITDWYRQTSCEATVAERWVSGFAEVVDGLAVDPDRHPRIREFLEQTRNIREVHYGSGRKRTHRIIFEITEDTVYVLRVKHHAQRKLTPDDF